MSRKPNNWEADSPKSVNKGRREEKRVVSWTGPDLILQNGSSAYTETVPVGRLSAQAKRGLLTSFTGMEKTEMGTERESQSKTREGQPFTELRNSPVWDMHALRQESTGRDF